MRTLAVNLGSRSYPIYIGAGLVDHSTLMAPFSEGRTLIVTNAVVAPLYLDRVERALAPRDVVSVVLPDGEATKTLDGLDPIFTALLSNRCGRDSTIIALGGGVVGDMAGFAAASYQRGIDFIQIPTTLLAQVDSSVGGKTGVNHPLGKNMIGAFHQPRAVVIDTNTLSTLPDRELSAGLAEVIKYGLIRDAGFFAWLEDHIDEIIARQPERLAEAIYRSCVHKAAVVGADEREAGARALLNLGHTFGHAIETGMGYGNWLHGEAVAAGMVLAAELSARLGHLTTGEVERIRTLIARARLPVDAPPLAPERYLELMAVDKKVKEGRLRFVLLRRLGEAVLVDDCPPGVLEGLLAGIAT